MPKNNSKISVKEFILLNEEEQDKLLDQMVKDDKNEEVIELLSFMNLEDLSSRIKASLVVAYNNNDDCEKAMEIASTVPEADRDAKWYYRYAYSLLYKNFPFGVCEDKEEVLHLFDKACALAETDEVKDWCAELVDAMSLETKLFAIRKEVKDLFQYYLTSSYPSPFFKKSVEIGEKNLSDLFIPLLEPANLSQNFVKKQLKAISGLKITAIDSIADSIVSLELSYQGQEHAVVITTSGFNIDLVEQFQLHVFNPETQAKLEQTKHTLVIGMELRGNPLLAYKLQLALAQALVPDMLALIDSNQRKVLNPLWVKQALASPYPPLAKDLYTIISLCDDEGNLWLQTRGLNRLNIHECEILESNDKFYEMHHELLACHCNRLIEKYVEALENGDITEGDNTALEERETLNLGQFSDKGYIVSTSLCWEEAREYYSPKVLGTDKDRDIVPSKSNILFLYANFEDCEADKVKKVTDFNDRFDYDCYYFVKKEMSEQRAISSQLTFPIVKQFWDKLSPEDKALARENEDGELMLTVTLPLLVENQKEGSEYLGSKSGEEDEENSSFHEHLWIKVLDIKDGKIEGVILSKPIYRTEYKQGDLVTFSSQKISAWLLMLKGERINYETAYLLELELSMKN